MSFPTPGGGSERHLALGVGREGRLAMLPNAMSGQGQFGLSRNDAIASIDRIARVVREWRTWFAEAGVPEAQMDRVQNAFRHPRDLGLEKIGEHSRLNE